MAGLDIDCVMIDTEHIPLGWHDLGWMCRAYRSLGIVPTVRIPRDDPFDACRVLDMGGGNCRGLHRDGRRSPIAARRVQAASPERQEAR